MGGQQSSDAPQEDTKVEEKTEPPKAEAVQAPKSEPEKQEAKDSEGKKNYSKMPDTKKASPKETKSQPKAPVPPGAQSSGSLAKQLAKQAPKAAAPKKKVQQPGPPQQPGLITPESAAKAKGKGEKGKGGKGKGFQGIQLCVRNLAKEATPDQLKGMFQPFGELLNVDVKKNTDGTCRGYGFVTFSSMEEAKKAISQMDAKILPFWRSAASFHHIYARLGRSLCIGVQVQMNFAQVNLAIYQVFSHLFGINLV